MLRIACIGWLLATTGSALLAGPVPCLSPDAIVATSDAGTLLVACGTASQVLWVDTTRNQVTNTLATPAPATGLALSADNQRLYVTCAAPASPLLTVDLRRCQITGQLLAGHTARSPVLSADGKTLFVCNQFNNDISRIDLATGRETGRFPVEREPVAADLTKDGQYLLVANQLSLGRADSEDVDADVDVIDAATGRKVKILELPDGSESLQGLRVSPDGKYAVVTHILSNFDTPTRRVDNGQINANALTILDLTRLQPLYTFYLDTVERGAGNPWAVAWSAGGDDLVITHAGTSEASIIDFQALLDGLPKRTKQRFPTDANTPVLKFAPHYEDDQEDQGRPFLVGACQRLKLPAGDVGPRAVVITGHMIYTANYFSDTLTAIDLLAPDSPAVSIPLGPAPGLTAARRGERYFNDATLCRGGWQSCASCHPGGGRVDGLNWMVRRNHPKNTKSLLYAAQTMAALTVTNGSPEMADSLDAAVRVSLQNLLFTNAPEAVVQDLEQYLQSLAPVPSPWLEQGQLSASARHGAQVFKQASCNQCHGGPQFTDRSWHDVGTRVRFDTSGYFLTPPLVELWRTAPYLHNGEAENIHEVLTKFNNHGAHGDLSRMSKADLDDLVAYLLSL